MQNKGSNVGAVYTPRTQTKLLSVNQRVFKTSKLRILHPGSSFPTLLVRCHARLIERSPINDYLRVLLLGYVFWQPLKGSGGGRNWMDRNLAENRASKVSPPPPFWAVGPPPCRYMDSLLVGGVGGSPPPPWENVKLSVQKLLTLSWEKIFKEGEFIHFCYCDHHKPLPNIFF